MSRGIGEAEVRRVAELAGLELGADEVDRLAEELGRVLEHFDRLRELELGDVGEPRGEAVRLRLDVPSADPLTAGPERAAPDWREGFFVVPRLPGMEGPEGSDDGAP